MNCNGILWPGRGGPDIDYITGPPAHLPPPHERTLSILGSTGSIGRNALAVVAKAGYKVQALAGGRNARLLAGQAIQFQPPFLAVLDDETAAFLKRLLPKDYRPEILTGPEGYACLAALEHADIVLSAQGGTAGLNGTLAAAVAGKTIALANKESLVAAGTLAREICRQSGSAILPVDSEHYALFQCVSARGQGVAELILTASGGPFRTFATDDLAAVSPEDALKHPNWNMGKKISIDSATMMNKGLELIEAVHLYGMSQRNISVLVHPQSIIHSLARMRDNSLLAQLAVPDMKLPIAACLAWPRASQSLVRPLDLADIGVLSFSRVNEKIFPALKLARKCLQFSSPPNWVSQGLNPACIVLNAANEASVELFLQHRCAFKDIYRLISIALEELVFKYCRDIPQASPDISLKDQMKLALNHIIELSGAARACVLKNAQDPPTA